MDFTEGTKALLDQKHFTADGETIRIRTVKVVDTNLATPGLVRIEYIDSTPLDATYTGRYGYARSSDLRAVQS
jgi:hypothetical protein